MDSQKSVTTTDAAFANLLEEMHVLRVSGEKERSTRTYERLWQSGTSATSLEAALWAADITMLRGQFDEVLTICSHLKELFADQSTDLQGDLYRFKALNYRFMFDFKASTATFEKARMLYQRNRTPKKIAGIETNRLEILAHTNPLLAIKKTPQILQLHKKLDCTLEQAKIHTAAALAHFQVANSQAAQNSMDQAKPLLKVNNYPAGQARADLVSSFIALQLGHKDRAVEAAELAVKEFTRQDTYPTLILTCDLVLRRHGISSPFIHDAALHSDAMITYHKKNQLRRRIRNVATHIASLQPHY